MTHRNALLKYLSEHRLFDLESIEVWDAQLNKLGSFIHEKRKEFLHSFIPVFNKFYQQIGDGHEQAAIEYKSQLTDADFSKILIAYLKKDSYSQYTNAGTHKDDLLFNIKDQTDKKYGTQGQKKTFVKNSSFNSGPP